MKVLTMGGTRFIGLHIVRQLVAQGHEVTTFNRGVSPGVLPPGVKRLYGDRKDHAKMREVLAGQEFDAIIDTSAFTLDDVEIIVEIFRGRIKNYVFTSTVGAYRLTQLAPITEEFPLYRVRDPRVRIQPESPWYPTGKTGCEDHLLDLYKSEGFPATMIRPGNVYGPENNGRGDLLLFIRLLRGRPILMPGEGNNFLHLSHVHDTAAAHVAVLNSPRALGEAYHIVDPYAITQKGFLELAARIVGKEPKIIHVPVEAAKVMDQQTFPYARKADGAWRWSAIYSIQKSLDHLVGWKPKYDTESGMRDYFQWVLDKGLDKMEYDFTYEDEIIRRLKGGFTPHRRAEA